MSQQYIPSKKNKGKQPATDQDDVGTEHSRDFETFPLNQSEEDAFLSQRHGANKKQLMEMMDRETALAVAAVEAEEMNHAANANVTSTGSLIDSGIHSLISNGSALLFGSSRTRSSSPDSPSTSSMAHRQNIAAGLASDNFANQRSLSGNEVEERLFMDKRNRLLKYIQETQVMLEEWRQANQEKMIIAFPYANPTSSRSGNNARANSISHASGTSLVQSLGQSLGFGTRRSRSSRPEMDHMSSSLSALPSNAVDERHDTDRMSASVQDISNGRYGSSSGPSSQSRPNYRSNYDSSDRLTPYRRGINDGNSSGGASDFSGHMRADPMSLSTPATMTEHQPFLSSSVHRERRGSGDSLAVPTDNNNSNNEREDIGPQEVLRVLQLDIKLNIMPTSGRVNTQLEPGSLAPLLDDRMASALRHLVNLHERVSDTSFKVIVAGDVNAGKSSLVNALLRRTVVPVDQQPLTSTFLEVLDARLNDDIEEAHACEDRRIYDRLNESTFWRVPLRHLDATVAEWTGDEHSIIKVYARQEDDDSALVHNDGVANLSIDVVVFVLNAENTLTLSGREFLEQASKEKAHLFFVINRFEGIRAKDRCARRILDQIKEVSPKTYDEADDLVHWISPTRVSLKDSGNGDDHGDDSDDDSDHGGNGNNNNNNNNNRGAAPDDWKNMERALRNFTLGRRARTKLEPAKIYLLNVLSDLRLLARMNRRDADQRLRRAAEALEASRPEYEKLVESQRDDCIAADRETEGAGDYVRQLTRQRLRAVMEAFEIHGGDPVWPGFSGMIGYVDAIRNSMIKAWENEVMKCEQAALEKVNQASEHISTLGMQSLTEPPRVADLSRLFTKHDEAHKLSVRIEIWDLVEIRERIGIATAGLGSVAMIASNLFGYKTLVVNAAQVGSAVGLQGAKRWFLFTATLASIGALTFIIGDMQYAVHRKVARKIRQHIQDTSVVDQHADRVAKRAHAALRFSAQDLRERYQRAVETERHQREQRAQDQLDAKERRRWFREMAKRAKELQELVNIVDCDDRKVPIT
ncbi:hypothetical protein BDF19DRAFT_428238 [Syncephalis fuscata]|nr:hypothetical protein BDF19DRAFT_428238 [Syncephalis fuscata]